MKKTIGILAVIIIVIAAGLGIWGYFKAQEVKKQGKAIERMTAGTLNLQPVGANDPIQLSDWKNLSDEAPKIKTELEKFTAASESLKESANQYYSIKAQDKYKEAQYSQILAEGQSSLDLKNNQPKSKGQIETVLGEFDNMQTKLRSNNLSLGPEFNTLFTKVQQEASTFRGSANNIASSMTFSSPAVQLNTAGFDKAIDELKQAVTKSLNDWVDLQNRIKNEIQAMSNVNWINPL